MKSRGKQVHRGAALIIAMLLTALGAAVAAQLIQPLAGWLKREYSSRDVQAAYTLADAASSWSLTVLAGDARLSTIDHYGELWATKLPATQIEGGMVEGQLVDLQSRFNLNSLAPRGVKNAGNVALAKQLFAAAKVPVGLVDTLADAIDKDDITDNGQLEAKQYAQPLRNTAIERLSDLLGVAGFTESHVTALMPFVEVLPEATPININTADIAYLRAAFPQLNSDVIAKFTALRKDKPFNSVNEFGSTIGIAVPEGMFSVATSYFGMNATVSFEHAAHRLQLRIQRLTGAPPKILSRTITNA
jgi:general secretion pathway protein K